MERTTDRTPEEAARRRKVLWLTLLLMIGLPIYIIIASLLAAAINPVVESADGGPPTRLFHWSIEVIVYLVLGAVWAIPLKSLVQGVGKPSPPPEG